MNRFQVKLILVSHMLLNDIPCSVPDQNVTDLFMSRQIIPERDQNREHPESICGRSFSSVQIISGEFEDFLSMCHQMYKCVPQKITKKLLCDFKGNEHREAT